MRFRFGWPKPSLRRIDLSHVSFEVSSLRNSTLQSIFADLRVAAETLGEIEVRPSTVVDIDAMVRRAILGEAQLKLAMKTRALVPNHLVLIQRLAEGDHFASLADEIVRQLRRRGVQVSDYTFGSEPTIFVARSGHGRTLTIDDLGREHGSDRLLILSDVSPFFGEAAGQLQRWVREFYGWQKRAILTPTPQPEWDYREATLAAEDFLLIPASRIGLEAVANEFSQSAEMGRGLPRNAGHGVVHPMREAPPDIRSRAARFFARSGSAIDPAATCRALEDFFGVQIRWLSACAVYPVLHWNLTLTLGLELAEAGLIEPVTMDSLFEISCLPWFREGRISNDLRLALIDRLSSSEATLIRTTVANILSSAVERSSLGGDAEISGAFRMRTSLRQRLSIAGKLGLGHLMGRQR